MHNYFKKLYQILPQVFKGGSLAEYGLVAMLIILVAVGSMMSFGQTVASFWEDFAAIFN